MTWNEIDRDTSITWLHATEENVYKLRAVNGGKDSEVSIYDSDQRSWVTVEPPSSAKIVQLTSTGGDQLILVDDAGEVFIADGERWSDMSMPAPARSVAARGGTLVGIDRVGGVWSQDDGSSDWTQIDDLVENDQIAMDGSDVFKRGARGSIWRFEGNRWERIDNNPTTVRLYGNGTHLLQTHTNRCLFQLHDGTSNWSTLEDSGTIVDVAAHGNRIFELRDGGHVWTYIGPTKNDWRDLDGRGGTKGLIAVGPSSVYLWNGERTYQNNV